MYCLLSWKRELEFKEESSKNCNPRINLLCTSRSPPGSVVVDRSSRIKVFLFSRRYVGGRGSVSVCVCVYVGGGTELFPQSE